MKRIVLVFLSILFVSALVLFTQNSVKGDSEYVGSEACKGCHEG